MAMPTCARSQRRSAPRCEALVVLAACALAWPAHAEPPSQAPRMAVTHPELDRPLLIGPSGQIYRPSAPDTWTRTLAGGVAADVVGAVVTPDGRVFVGGAETPLYELGERAWHAHSLPNRGSLVLASRGAAVAVHTHVHVYDGRGWKRTTSLDSPITALWAGPRGELVAATRRGDIARLAGAAWTRVRVPLADGDRITQIVGRDGKALHAVTANGALFVVTRTRVDAVTRDLLLAGLVIHAVAPAPDGALWVAGQLPDARDDTGQVVQDARLVLARTQRTTLSMVEPITDIDAGDRISVLAIPGPDALLLGTAQGVFRIRDARGAWRSGTIASDLASTPWRGPPAGPARTR